LQLQHVRAAAHEEFSEIQRLLLCGEAAREAGIEAIHGVLLWISNEGHLGIRAVGRVHPADGAPQ
jgi:hypothetical protein